MAQNMRYGTFNHHMNSDYEFVLWPAACGHCRARRSRVADFRNAPHKLKIVDPDGHILQLTLHITMELERESNITLKKESRSTS